MTIYEQAVENVMKERNVSRKSAVQYLRRQNNKTSALLLTTSEVAAVVESNAYKAVEELETLPPAQSLTVTPASPAVSTPEEVFAAPAEIVQASKRPRREASLQEEWFRVALAADIAARPKLVTCKHGHDLTDAQHVHVDDLRRTGKR